MTLAAIAVAAALSACVLGATPLLINESPSGYHLAYENLVKAEVQLLMMLPDNSTGPMSNESLNYLLLEAVVAEVSDNLLNYCTLPTYDNETYYNAVNNSLLRVENDTQAFVDSLLSNVAQADVKSSLVILQVSKLCDTDHLNETACDLAVNDLVKKDPDAYKKPAHLLLALGDLGALYLNNTYVELANNNTMLEFLLTDGLEELRPLLNNVAAVKKLYTDSCL